MVTINGVKYAIAGVKLLSFLEDNGYDKTRIAVEKNGDIVPKATYETTVLCDGDKIEIVSFVGGG